MKLAGAFRKLVDGRGAERVALALMAEALSVRPARMEDAKDLFDWRNAPQNRRRMNEQNSFDWDSHLAWLERVLGDTDRRLLIGEIGDHAVGVIRFDGMASEWPEVSLHLHPDLSGLGLGPHLLRSGEEAVDLARIMATVLEDNEPSQRLFERAGYRHVGTKRWEKSRTLERMAS